ncbi:plasmid partitioning protein RepB [Ketogulonicigenium vulgare]|uniref:ParB-like protein partition protein n=1 Tax=Ketogulonicigenium vulgare (strain WSH-001) TaxID=759362 RepID=F9YB95_KETVW|nr:plasmid partitioning protein RepB [Ketogulonicigenium vulgare]AEM42647.1 ParB-like protein partition protein [Ketogulonicigenium vulgare WSH-001]ALJ82655.1 plasmid partitioning protein RepB [Ketogulonicigenium vulgare]ANW35404.1 plasmid partitioning protein RepB [Ketogulonicigenium vulgare]AOZ53349.1 ParB-like protein partition protein [Ketogulonicigenium vulgare]
MARKNILEGLMTPKAEPPAAAPEIARPRSSAGAIGAVSRSIADLKSRAMLDIDPFEIDAGGFQDRLGFSNADDAALLESLREYGQQVPILVRPHPDRPGRYQIVYGRRRVLAMRDLGLPVKALVRELDDSGLIMAQGQENTARRELSFIEKANFALQMQQAGFSRKLICDALSIDKTLISRMLSVAERIPNEVIRVIGPATSIGRDRWLYVADLYEKAIAAGMPEEEPLLFCQTDVSEERFEAVLSYLTSRALNLVPQKEKKNAEEPPIISAEGRKLATLTRPGRSLVLTMPQGDFAEWLADELPLLHKKWQAAMKS